VPVVCAVIQAVRAQTSCQSRTATATATSMPTTVSTAAATARHCWQHRLSAHDWRTTKFGLVEPTLNFNFKYDHSDKVMPLSSCRCCSGAVSSLSLSLFPFSPYVAPFPSITVHTHAHTSWCPSDVVELAVLCECARVPVGTALRSCCQRLRRDDCGSCLHCASCRVLFLADRCRLCGRTALFFRSRVIHSV
jgi:hypothetical protein